MPFYLRKSVRAGPFRFNLSNSGVGVSVGVKGLRIGTGPRGHYVHAGRGGLYYRASLGGAPRTSSPHNLSSQAQPKTYAEPGGVTMIEVQSGDVAAMRDATVTDLVEDLNKKQAQLPPRNTSRVRFRRCWRNTNAPAIQLQRAVSPSHGR